MIMHLVKGFLGHVYREIFHGRPLGRAGIEDFIQELDSYLHWFYEKHIKMSSGRKNPMEYRKGLGLIT